MPVILNLVPSANPFPSFQPTRQIVLTSTEFKVPLNEDVSPDRVAGREQLPTKDQLERDRNSDAVLSEDLSKEHAQVWLGAEETVSSDSGFFDGHLEAGRDRPNWFYLALIWGE